MSKKKIYIISKEHFDIVWRRCFDRNFEFKGQNYVSYADLQEYYVKDNIELCKKYPEYNFEIESVTVLDKFLERNPDYEEIISKYLDEKRIYIPFSGVNIVDSNMTNGESIVRNFLYGYHYLKNRFGYIANGIDRNDAFGNSAQIPQIVRKFGSKWVSHIVYTPCTSPYWRGLDGSVVYNLEPPRIGDIGGYLKYRPCPVCNGYDNIDCDYCNNRRVDEKYMNRVKFPLKFDKEAVETLDVPGYIYSGGEEVLPTDNIIKWAAENQDKYDIEFIPFNHYEKYYKDYIENVDNAAEEDIYPSAELNANNTGTFVTRIKVKQAVRKLENSIFAAEALSVAAGGEYPYEKFKKVWNNALFTMFHDALPSTVIDAGYYEIMDAAGEAQKITDGIIEEKVALAVKEKDGILTVFNPTGIELSADCEVRLNKNLTVEGVSISDFHTDGDEVIIKFGVDKIGAFETREYKIVEDSSKYKSEVLFEADKETSSGSGVLTNLSPRVRAGEVIGEAVILENEFYKITAENNGISEIYDKKLGKVVAQKSEYMVGEWILEHDEGSPWATLSPDMRRQPMSKYTKIVYNEKTPDYQRVTYKIKPGPIDGYSVSGIVVAYSITLAKNNDKIIFSADVDWDTQNYRFRLAFPSAVTGKHIYEIPYGMLERKPYEHTIVFDDDSTNWASAAGDYPAINWAGIDAGDTSLALFNNGTPSYQINTDKFGKQNIYLSVLRSPSVGTYLHSPLEYSMTDYDGMRDVGVHHFEYALKSYDKGFDENSVVADGIAFNTKLVTLSGGAKLKDMPRVLTDNARISAIIPSQDKKGIIMRVAEFRGKDSELKIKLPDYVKSVKETDMKEDVIGNVTTADNIISSKINHFEIKTFYLEV